MSVTAPSSSPLRTSVQPLRPDDKAALSALRRLFDRDPEAYALQHPEYLAEEVVDTKAGHLASTLVTLAGDGDPVAAAVLMPKRFDTQRWGGVGPGWTLDGFRLAGNRVLVDPATSSNLDELTRKILAAAIDQVKQSGGDFLFVEDLDRPSALEASLRAAVPSGWTIWEPSGVAPRLRIRFPDPATEYWTKFSSKTRSTFRRKLKKFGKTRLDRITREDQVPAFLKAAHEISLQTWQTRHLGLRVADDEASRRKLAAQARVGLLRSYLWWVDDVPASFCVGNVAHGKFNYEEVGYATKFAKFSPGQMMVVQMLEDLVTHEPVKVFDFGGGDAEYKRMFANETATSATLLIAAPTFKARGTVEYLRAMQSVRRVVRDAVTRSPWATKARQWIRYGRNKPQAAPQASAPDEAAE